MRNSQRKSPFSYIPGYSSNSVLHLIVACGVAYAILGVSWAIIMIIFNGNDATFNRLFMDNIALPSLPGFTHHWWTILIYGWFQYPNNFMELLSNMVWLYLFGSVVQMLIGRRQIIPLFFYSLLLGGLFYYIIQFIPAVGNRSSLSYFLGPRAGITGMAIAAFTLSPNYRFYFTETFSVPIIIITGIFALLILVSSGFYLPIVFLIIGGGLAGFLYIKLLRSGFHPANWIYAIMEKMESWVTPKDNVERSHIRIYKDNRKGSGKPTPKVGITQKKIDELLDKINQKGYKSLSQEEKDILNEASK